MEIVKEENDVNVTPQQEGEVTNVTETPPAPTVTSEKTFSIVVTSYSDGKQDLKVNTPEGEPLSDCVGMFEIAKTLLLKRL
jgi:hypothetical protein